MIRILKSANEFQTNCVQEHDLIPSVIYTTIDKLGFGVKFTLPVIVVDMAHCL